jgi:hypothetical protein
MAQQKPATLLVGDAAASARKRSKASLVRRSFIPIFRIMGEGKVITGVLDAGLRLDKALAEASGLSRERVKALIGEGRVTLGGKPVEQASAKSAGGDFAIEVPRPTEATATPRTSRSRSFTRMRT